MGIIPSIKLKGAIAIVESTCQRREAFYGLYTQSFGLQSKWKHSFFPWYKNPKYVSNMPHELTEQE